MSWPRVCGSCVHTLALKLLSHNNKLDLIRAYELAEKGVERVEKRRQIKPGIRGRDDYTQDCVGSTPGYPQFCGTQMCLPREPLGCTIRSACSGTCDCPDPLENSHQVTDGCDCEDCCPNYEIWNCPEGCNCHCVGTCGYDCDEGYEWDGEACVPIAVPAKPLINKPLVNPTLVNQPTVRS